MRPKWGVERERRSNHGEVEKRDGARLQGEEFAMATCARLRAATKRRPTNVPRSGVTSSGPETAWSGGFGRGDVRIGGLRGFSEERDLICNKCCKGELGADGRRYRLICNLEKSRRFLLVFFLLLPDCCGSPGKGTS